MKALVIGATGYVGSVVAGKLRQRGYDTHGLARNPKNRETLDAAGVVPVQGDVDDLAQLTALARAYDVVVFVAMVPFEKEAAIVQSLIEGLKDRPASFVFTSGTGVLSIEAKDGHWNEHTFGEDDDFPFPARYNRSVRLETESRVRRATGGGLETFVIRPPLIYGRGGSIQVPQIFESARKTGAACYLGAGLNLYSNVHVDDLAEIYCLALERGTGGALYHAVAGEANFRSIAEAVASVLGCEARSLTYEQACDLWGAFWVDLALAVNSRSRCPATRQELGWVPQHRDLIEDIRSGSYRDRYGAGSNADRQPYHWLSHG